MVAPLGPSGAPSVWLSPELMVPLMAIICACQLVDGHDLVYIVQAEHHVICSEEPGRIVPAPSVVGSSFGGDRGNDGARWPIV